MIDQKQTFLTTAEDGMPPAFSSYDGPVCHFFGRPVRDFPQNKAFELKTVQGIQSFFISDQSVYSAPAFSPADVLHVLARKHKNDAKLTALAVCSPEDYSVFQAFQDLDTKLKAIQVYATMTQTQRREILRQRKAAYVGEDVPEAAQVTSMAHKKLKFDLCADSYPLGERQRIRSLFLENNGRNNKNDLKLTYLLNIDTRPAPLPDLPVSSLVQEMDRTVFALEGIKRQLAEKAQSRQPILLVGGQRVCAKLASALAKGLSIPLEEIDLTSLSNGLDLLGADATFDKAGPGKLVERMYAAGTARMLFHFARLDRVNTTDNKEGSCLDALLHILSPSRRLEDHFLEQGISTKETFFIGSASCLSAVPEELRRRFFILELPEYTARELCGIARQFLLPALWQEADADPETVSFPDETLLDIARQYCEGYSAGRMKGHLRSLLAKAREKQSAGALPVPCSVTPAFAREPLEREVDPAEPDLVFHRNRDKYPPSVLKKLLALGEEGKNLRLPQERQTAARESFALLSGLYPRFDAARFDLKRFYNTVHATHYGMDEVADRLAGVFLLGGQTPPRLLLSGPPGTGKSSVIQSLAEAVGWPVLRIPCNDAGAVELRRRILRGLSRVGTAAVLHLDELDKLTVPAANDLLDILDDSRAVHLPDLDITLDLSHLIIIATGNNADDLARACPALFDRLVHIPLPGYTLEEKAVIARRYLLPRLAEHRAPVETDEQTLDFLLRHYCRAPGIRDVEKALQAVCQKQKLRDAREGFPSSRLLLTRETVLSALGAPPPARGNFPSQVTPGLARGLAVCGGSGQGVSFAVETLLTPGLPGLQITGLAAECARESVELCRSFLAAYYPQQFRSDGLHVHFGEAAVPTDGPSAGAAVAVSMLSAMLGRPVPGESAFTGEIDLHGNLFPVGGIRAKVQAACLDGCARVFLPRQNLPELEDAGLDIQLVPVSHVSEILSALFFSQPPLALPVRPAV